MGICCCNIFGRLLYYQRDGGDGKVTTLKIATSLFMGKRVC